MLQLSDQRSAPPAAPSGRAASRHRPDGEVALRLRNVRIGGRRTSLRLEAPMWDALEEVALRESLSLDQLITLVAGRNGGNLSSAVRTFLLGYFRAAATEQGHSAAGHGLFHRR